MTGTILGLRALFHPDGFRHHTFIELKQSAEDGCYCCVFIENRLRSIPKRWDESSTLVFQSPFNSEKYTTYTDDEFEDAIEGQAARDNPQSGFACLDLYVTLNDPIHWSNRATSFFLYNNDLDGHKSPFVKRQAMLIDVATDFAFRKARGYLENCQNTHVKCPGKKMPVLPRRVLDVGVGSSPEYIKLKVNDTPTKAPYVALSYCWGGSQQTTTTASTLSDYIANISYHILPKTIQDAVTATRKLGMRYLWVDALCIIQDCAVDKAKEVNNMGQIYKNATLTIAAASAKTASDGFLQPRQKIPSCEIKIYHNWQRAYRRAYTGKMTFEAWMEGKLPPKVWLSATVKSSDHDEPLYSRGWTLQERLLSPCVLLYGRREVTWQCQQSSSESMGKTFYQRSTGCKRLPVSIFVNKKLKRKERPSDDQIKKVWKSIIEDYTRRDLSFVEDRLPALAGIAEQLQHIWGDYVAGFWKDCIVAHLGWRRAGPRQTMPPSEVYIAPTWSWASFTGKVEINTVNRADAEILDCAVEPLNDQAPLGQIRSGYLRIRAVAIYSKPSKSKKEFPGFEITMDHKTGLGEETRLLYMLLGSEDEYEYKQPRIVGLVLLGKADGTYTRVGQFRSSRTLETIPVETDDTCQRMTLTIV